MDEKIIKSTSDQAAAAWIDRLRILRINELYEKLAAQDINTEAAFAEIEKLKEFVSDPSHILGSMFSKHGEIAEHAEVRFVNADYLLDGKTPIYDIDTVGRFDKADYYRLGEMVQSKFYKGIQGTLTAIAEHMDTYPNYLEERGGYVIAKDHFEELNRIYSGGESNFGSLNSSDAKMYEAIKEWEQEIGHKFTDVVKPSVLSYDEVQLDSIHNTITEKENALSEKDANKRNIAKEEAKPSLEEGMKATAIAAVLEGGIHFATVVYRNRKNGKKIQDYTADDWKDLGLDTLDGTIKGAIRGSGIYVLTNQVLMPAPIASAFISASFGMIALAEKLHKHEIDSNEFIDASESICLDVSVSGLSSLVGQVLIPVPVLGAIIGNATGMFMLNIAQTHLDKYEQDLIIHYQNEINDSLKQYSDSEIEVFNELQARMYQYNSVIDLAFDRDVNKRFLTSVQMATLFPGSEKRIIHSFEMGNELLESDEPIEF